ncbi:hypothetical protein ACFXDE_14890, partial [Kitasatospora sp. NPDC059408]
ARAVAGSRPGASGPGAAQRRPQGAAGPHPRPEAASGGRPVRDRQQTPAPGQPGGRDRGRPRDRQHTPAPGRPTTPRQRLLRQRLVVFVTVTIGVALAIAAAQGCENRSNQGMRPSGLPTMVVLPTGLSVDGAAVPGTASATPSATASVTASATASATPVAAAARGGTGAGAAASGTGAADLGLAPAQAPGPAVDWPNRTYPDGAGGPGIALHEGRSAAGGPQVSLSSVLPTRYKGSPATVVVLRRAEGSVPVDLVQLYTFSGDNPVAAAARSSTADPQATASWRLDAGAVVREERVAQTGAVTSTRYTVRPDGSLDESWPGAGASGGTGLTAAPPAAAAPAPPTTAAG